MHMADALLSPPVAIVMDCATASMLALSVVKLRKDDSEQRLPTMAVTAALVFAGQMINYSIPGTGSSGHLCGGMLLSALLGPYAGFLSMSVILAIQCLFFADGGLMALGANIWNMAFYGCFVGYFLIWRPIMRRQSNSKGGVRGKIILASILGCVITLQMGAFSVCVETTASGISDLPFGGFLALMQPIHLAIGLIEGGITAAVLTFVYQARPELVKDAQIMDGGSKSKHALRNTLIVLGVAAGVVAGGFSLLASSKPDGLEWSLFGNAEDGYSENMGLDEEKYGVDSGMKDNAEAVQDKTSFLPDYGFKGNEENPAGTMVSGLVGAAIVAAAVVGLCFLGGFFRKRKAHAKTE